MTGAGAAPNAGWVPFPTIVPDNENWWLLHGSAHDSVPGGAVEKVIVPAIAEPGGTQFLLANSAIAAFTAISSFGVFIADQPYLVKPGFQIGAWCNSASAGRSVTYSFTVVKVKI